MPRGLLQITTTITGVDGCLECAMVNHPLRSTHSTLIEWSGLLMEWMEWVIVGVGGVIIAALSTCNM